MRSKSEERRQAIMATAAEVFREVGFEQASMAQIAARVGGSKTTLYNYFPSKEDLFVNIMMQAAEADMTALFGGLQLGQGSMEETLLRFGQRFLQLVCTDEMLALRRLLITAAGSSDIGRQFYARGPQRGMNQLALYLQQMMEQGQLCQEDPQIAARHLKGLLESEMLELCTLRVEQLPTAQRIEAVAQRAVRVFLRGYQPT
ncbi:TetR/AcrR family transcriptional regulator [Pokkaliibacter sp. MBI-7]|uniref:TetR/AcrR family transcriptional regulator n=1 Tax=Pokkaliibacter sp. MBI-7 TaxID=3040600 RepID=UPI0024486036|nr:TetR/AcrR family transcriptional regulator [Pokkaliibacter sp. MBI-7]MDH2432457.1 TetR/AcrR family transcriptional regulator [Pokkaliibacter sp. MBI-7]